MLTRADRIPVEDLEVNHYITNSGLYAREMLIPAGVIVTGKIKKHEHLSIISCGFCTEVTNQGLQQVKAPLTMVSLPGTKRIVWAHTDVVWVTIHAVQDLTDMKDIEAYLIVEEKVQ